MAAVRELRAEMQKLESKLDESNGLVRERPDESESSVTEFQSLRNANEANTSGKCLDCKWYFKGMQILSFRGAEWMSSRTGETVSLSLFQLLAGPNRPSPASPASVPAHELHQLPEEQATFEAIGIFNHASAQYSLPMLDRVLFQETIKQAYMEPEDANSLVFQVPPKACVWALHAITSRLQLVWGQGGGDGEKSAQRALILLQLVAEKSSLEALQATLLLVCLQKETWSILLTRNIAKLSSPWRAVAKSQCITYASVPHGM